MSISLQQGEGSPTENGRDFVCSEMDQGPGILLEAKGGSDERQMIQSRSGLSDTVTHKLPCAWELERRPIQLTTADSILAVCTDDFSIQR